MDGTLLREETPGDYKEIRRLVKTAFETAKVSSGDEHDFVERLRVGGNYIPELALVAVQHKIIIGHIMLTRHPVHKDNGDAPKTLLLAPLAVLLDKRDQGVGAMLVREALRRAKVLQYDGVFLAGDPAYYSRFGFVSVPELGVTYSGPVPLPNMLGLELTPGALKGVSLSLAHDK